MKMESFEKCMYMALSHRFFCKYYEAFIDFNMFILGCYSSSKDSDTQSVIGCPDEAPYCLNSLTNYVNGKTEVEKV